MTESAGQKDRNGNLRELSDPEFFTEWAIARNRLFFPPRGGPGNSEVKRWYGAVSAEYRRRMNERFAFADGNDRRGARA